MIRNDNGNDCDSQYAIQFIHCTHSFHHPVSNSFDAELVLQQLRYSGVLEAVQIRKMGFPVRKSHLEFRQLYWMLHQNCRLIYKSTHWKLGAMQCHCLVSTKYD